jgi:hypothetical protein
MLAFPDPAEGARVNASHVSRVELSIVPEQMRTRAELVA